jgi:hypothetical protein
MDGQRSAFDLEGVTDLLVSEMPEPQQHAIDAAVSTGATDAPEVSGELDALGIPWNSTDHAVSSDGSHPKTQKGVWKRRRNRKGSESTLRTPGGPTATPIDPAQEQRTANEVAARQTGAVIAGMFLTTLGAIGGDEWKPRKESIVGDESVFMTGAFGDFCVAKGYTDLTPGWALVFAISIYSGQRFAMPDTRTRMQKVWAWCKEKVFAWRNRRAGRKAKKEEKHETDSAD